MRNVRWQLCEKTHTCCLFSPPSPAITRWYFVYGRRKLGSKCPTCHSQMVHWCYRSQKVCFWHFSSLFLYCTLTVFIVILWRWMSAARKWQWLQLDLMATFLTLSQERFNNLAQSTLYYYFVKIKKRRGQKLLSHLVYLSKMVKIYNLWKITITNVVDFEGKEAGQSLKLQTGKQGSSTWEGIGQHKELVAVEWWHIVVVVVVVVDIVAVGIVADM